MFFIYPALVGTGQCEVDYRLRMSTIEGIRELTTTKNEKELASYNQKNDHNLRALKLGIPFRSPLEAKLFSC